MLQALGITLSRTQLLERCESLRTEIGATNRFRSIDDEGQYEYGELTLEDTPFWCPKLSQILDDIETSVAYDPRIACEPPLTRASSLRRAMSEKGPASPGTTPKRERTRTVTRRGTITGTLKEFVVPLYDEEIGKKRDKNGVRINATRAGYELAKYLRSRDFLVIHVFPSLDCVLPDVGCFKTATLVKLIASIIYAVIPLIRPESITTFWTAGQALSECRFKALARGDASSYEAGLGILAGLPKLDLLGARKVVFIIDGLDTAVSDRTGDKVSKFERALRALCERERAHLIYTLSDSTVQLGG
ncbi:hypothetical protein SCUP515_00186 [Seiridium cupressi]